MAPARPSLIAGHHKRVARPVRIEHALMLFGPPLPRCAPSPRPISHIHRGLEPRSIPQHDASSPARPRAAHEGAECDAGTKAQQSEAPKAATAVGVRPPRPVTTADFFLGSVIFVLCTFKSLWCCLRPVFSVMLTARTHTPIRILQPNTKTLGR